jgi:hypothetical protein
MNKKCDEPRVREIVKEELELNSCNEPVVKKTVEEVINGEGQNFLHAFSLSNLPSLSVLYVYAFQCNLSILI